MSTNRAHRRWGLLGIAGAAAAVAIAAGPAQAAFAATAHPGSGHGNRHRLAGASDADNGRTITLHRGDRLTVTLHSTYWSIRGSSAPAVLHEKGAPASHPTPARCVPGQGCGTVTATFDAVRRGTADVTAARTTCGEAMQCAPAQRDYVLHVVVAG